MVPPLESQGPAESTAVVEAEVVGLDGSLKILARRSMDFSAMSRHILELVAAALLEQVSGSSKLHRIS